MSAFLTEWAQLGLRWIHVLAAIAWIGHAFLFHALEKALRPPAAGDVSPDVRGELWMVHGGAFFRLQKVEALPAVITGELHWFKYEALLTWVSGFLLLVSMYWLTGGALMVDAQVAPLSPRLAVAVGAGALALGWLGYDAIWGARGRSGALPVVLSALWLGGLAIAMTQLLSGRAAFLHAGAMLGTLMTANVWMRILPASRRNIAAMLRGEAPDPRLTALGHQRSVHNGYLHFPIVFLMISAHYPSTYAHPASWAVLLLIVVLGASFRQVLYDRRSTHPAVLATVLGAALALAGLTAPRPSSRAEPPPVAGKEPIPSAGTAPISGSITFPGEVPPPREITLIGGCERAHDGPVRDDALLVRDGRVENALVWLSAGWERWDPGPPPTDEVAVDQRGCLYTPRIHGVRVGQPVTFVNSDPLFHNVRTVADQNEVFNLNMPSKDERIVRTFRRPEVAVGARCDVHPWMVSWIGVFPHDWWARSDAEGRFRIDRVPPGTYTLAAWHEVLGRTSMQLTLDGAAVTADLALPGASR